MLSPLGPALHLGGRSRVSSASSFWILLALLLESLVFFFCWVAEGFLSSCSSGTRAAGSAFEYHCWGCGWALIIGPLPVTGHLEEVTAWKPQPPAPQAGVPVGCGGGVGERKKPEGVCSAPSDFRKEMGGKGGAGLTELGWVRWKGRKRPPRSVAFHHHHCRSPARLLLRAPTVNYPVIPSLQGFLPPSHNPFTFLKRNCKWSFLEAFISVWWDLAFRYTLCLTQIFIKILYRFGHSVDRSSFCLLTIQLLALSCWRVTFNLSNVGGLWEWEGISTI